MRSLSILCIVAVCFCAAYAQDIGIEDIFGENEGPLNPTGGEDSGEEPIKPEPPKPETTDPPVAEKPKVSLTKAERASLLEAHNDVRKKQNLELLVWSPTLEINANMIVDCNNEFPGPAPTYTNFDKSKSGPSSDVVAAWGNEGPNLRNSSLADGCRPSFYGGTRCNHFTNLMQGHVRRLGCATRDCEEEGTQLTCLYIDYEDYRPYEGLLSGGQASPYGRRRR